MSVLEAAKRYVGTGTSSVMWPDVIRPLLASMDKIQTTVGKIDISGAKKNDMPAFDMDKSKLVDSVRT